MVLEYLDTTLNDASRKQKFDRWDIKRAVKAALDGMAILYAHTRAHRGESGFSCGSEASTLRFVLMFCTLTSKPDNIFANNGTENARFGTIQLGDFVDSVSEDVATNNGDYIIGAANFRASEVIFNAQWTVVVDIWSLGATVR